MGSPKLLTGATTKYYSLSGKVRELTAIEAKRIDEDIVCSCKVTHSHPMGNHENVPQEPTVPEPQDVINYEDLDTLHRLHFPAILRYIGKIVNNWDEAPDLTQDTFENALVALNGNNHPSGQNPVRLKGALSWLYRIARNKAIDYSRKQNRMSTEPIDGYTDYKEQASYIHSGWQEVQSALIDPHGNVEETVERRTALQNVFNGLPPNMARPLYLACVMGYSYAEIAAEMNVGEDTIKTLIHRARRKLREQQIAKSANFTEK